MTTQKMPVLYVKLTATASVREKEIRLGQVAELWCQPEEMQAYWEGLLLQTVEAGKKKRYVWSALDILERIHRENQEVDVRFLGAEDVVVDCRRTPDKTSLWSRLQTAAVGLVAFVGGGFAIMTFNNDVDVGKIFETIYQRVMHEASNGRTVLEASYSLGLFLGIVLFFNHLAGWKLTEDPTPLEVQMRQYEKDVAEAIVDYAQSGSGTSAKSGEKGGEN
ncbi:MAG: stage V sporulation protein AA [Lachnospiraceae bacterium]|nr:stage V sporulation protein AA [Lachnospiraceae bacterium]